MAIKQQTIELQRLVRLFESEAAKFHDLQMTLHFVTQSFSQPYQKFRSPNHGIMLWQFYGAIKDETDVELALTNLEKSDQKWGLRGAELSCFAVVEGEASSLFVRMAKRAGAMFDESEAKTIKARIVDEIREGKKEDYPQAKLVTVTNDDPLAVWLNFLLYHLSMTNSGREKFHVIQPDPFTISLLALERLAKDQNIVKVDRSTRKIDEIVFKVAMSFPGEKRAYVEEVVEALRPVLGPDTVFYDYDYQAQLARPNLDLLLQDIYRKRSDLIVLFLCDDYAQKQWCGLEWRAIRDIINCRQDDRIMFVRFDDATVGGIFSFDGYIDARSFTGLEVANLIAERVGVMKSCSAKILPKVTDAEIPVIGVSKQLQQDIERLHISKEVRQSVYKVLAHPEYPRWMAISGKLIKNPIWEGIPTRTRRQLMEKYRIDGLSAPQIMHLDLLLIRCNDTQGHGQIYTYFSPRWGTNLITFRSWLPEDNPDHRQDMNAAQLSKYLPVSADSISVTPISNKFAVSVKRDEEYGDLKIYIYEFCSVVFKETPNSLACEEPKSHARKPNEGPWFYLQTLRNDKKSSAVNGDVIRALYDLFSVTLRNLPPSLPDGFSQNGVD